MLAFDQTPNHRAQHTKYCLKISNCLGLHHFVPLLKKKKKSNALLQLPSVFVILQSQDLFEKNQQNTAVFHNAIEFRNCIT